MRFSSKFPVMAMLVVLVCTGGYHLFGELAEHPGGQARGPESVGETAAGLDTQSLFTELVMSEPVGHGSGSWEFPESRWRMRTGEVHRDDDLQIGTEFEIGEWQPDPLDEQFLFLVRQLMQPERSVGALQEFAVNTPKLRGRSVIQRSDTGELILSLCLRWPADGELWNEVLLERRDGSELHGLLTELPAGAKQRAVRRRLDGAVDCEVFETGLSGSNLKHWMQDQGWEVRSPPGLESVFWAAKETDRLEATLHTRGKGDVVLVVLRTLLTPVHEGDLR